MRGVALAAALSLMAVLGVVVAPAASPACTRRGTPERDIMAGGNGPDVLCAKAGADYLAGGGGKDTLRGDGGADVLVGGPGPDHLKGMKGSDRLFAVDGHTGDTLNGGKAHDDCFADPGDVVKNCEDVFRGASLKTARGLSNAFLGQGSLAQELIGGGGTVTDTVTVTVTIPGVPGPTVTTPFPACTPPPASPPPVC